jgi:hypothetical protein
MTRRWPAVLLGALLVAPLASCSDDGPGEGEARLEVDGEAVVEREGGDRDTVDGDTDLSSGDRVTLTKGTAVMRLRGGTTFELRKGFGDAADTAVLMADRPVLEAGDLLVVTSGVARVEADGTEVDVSEGAARVSRAFGMSVSAYDADVRLDSAGAVAEIPALRSMAVPDLGRPPRDPRPVSFDEDELDPWDRRYLGVAIELGKNLETLAGELTDLLPEGGGRTEGFFKLVLPGLEEEEDFDQPMIDLDRAPGETLIGAAITDLGENDSFTDRWREVFGFRDQGADWGIVAFDQEVRSEPLVGTVEEAFNTSFDEVAQAPSAPAGDTDGGGDGGTDGTGTDGTDGGSDAGTDGSGDGGTDGGTPPTTPTTEPPTTPTVPPPPPPPETPDELDPVIDPVVDLVDDLLGGLLP